MIGFGLLGATLSRIIRKSEKEEGQLTGLESFFIVAGGVTAAFVVFLGSYAMLGDQTSEPNPYVVFVTCLVGAVFSEDIWTWAREKFMPKKEEEAAKLAKEKEAKEKEAKEKEAKEKEAKEKEAKEKEAKEKEAKEKEAKEKEAKEKEAKEKEAKEKEAKEKEAKEKEAKEKTEAVTDVVESRKSAEVRPPVKPTIPGSDAGSDPQPGSAAAGDPKSRRDDWSRYMP